MTRNLKKQFKLGKVNFSNSRLLIFALAFAFIGGYFIFRSFAAPTWSAPVRLTNDNGSAFYSMASSGSNLYMVRGVDGSISLKKSTNEGTSWGSTVNIASGNLYLDRPLVAEGNTLALAYFKDSRNFTDWCCNRDAGNIYMRISTDGGATWGTEKQISTAQSAYRLAVEIEGSNVYVTWMDYRSGSTWDLYYRRTTNLGSSWGAETRLVQGVEAVGAERPDLVVRGSSVHLFWHDGRDNQAACYTQPHCPEVYYKRSTDGGATWGANIRLTSDSALHSARPIAAAIGASDLVVTYEQQIANDPDVSNEVYAMHSANDGITWDAPQRLTYANGDTGHNYIAGNNTGAYLAYHDARNGSNEIYFRQTDDAGISWQPEERITNMSGDSLVPVVAVTPNYVQVIWGDNNSGDYQVWYSRKALAAAPTYQCSDGQDNDSDGKIDYPADPGCTSSTDNDETDPAAPGASYYISPSGSDSGSCTQAAPCASFNRAYQIAAPGSTVSVAAGTYPTQIISWRANMESLSPGCDPNNPSQLVTFDLPNSIRITGNLEVHGSCVYLHGRVSGTMASWKTRSFTLNVDGYTSTEGDSATQYPKGVRIEGINSGNLGSYSSDRVIVRDADVGPRLLDIPCNYPENRIAANGASGHAPEGVLWERVAIHDQNRTQAAANADCHYGGLQFWYSKNVTIRDSVFERNVVYHIDLGESGVGPVNGVLINNSFGCPADNSWVGDRCDGQRAVQFDQPANFGLPFTLTGNVAANGPNGLYGCYSEPCSFTGMTISGNTDLAESLIAPPLGSTSPPPTKPGDLNSDNQVNILDLSILLTNYNTSNSNSDINKDGTVNIIDLSILLTNYGT